MTEPPSPDRPLRGSCLCGGVAYEISGPLGEVYICHCTMCRKAQGTAFGANTPVREADFKLLRGGDLIEKYESSPNKWRCFCRRCGAPIYSHATAKPGVLRVRLGLLDDDPGIAPVAHVMAETRAPWFEITDDLPIIDVETGRALPPAERKTLAKRRD